MKMRGGPGAESWIFSSPVLDMLLVNISVRPSQLRNGKTVYNNIRLNKCLASYFRSLMSRNQEFLKFS